MSEWIESHPELADHPKLHILASELSVRNPAAIGTLHLLWWFTLRFSWQDGNLKRFGPVAIARACQWDGEPLKLIKALQRAGFLDGYKVHDWFDFAGRLVKDRIRYSHANGNRPQSVRKRDAIPPPDVANRTVPNRTVPNQKEERGESPPAATAAPRIAIPYVEFLKTWNDNCGSLARISALSDKRRQKIRERWLGNPSLDYWLAVIRRMARSSFCQGKSDRGWRADFDFLIANDTNHLKVMEGKYDDMEGKNASDGGAGISEYAAIARANREAAELRKKTTAGTVPPRV